MPFSENIIPSDERIQGTHIAEYAKKLKSNDELYKSRFSSNLDSGLEPEDYQTHFSEVKDRIVNDKSKKKSDNQSKSISKTRSHKKKGDSK
jgi:large subunit ribosomal protein L18